VKRLIVLRCLGLVGVAVCAALLVEALVPGGALCGHGGGCEEVMRSAWARPLGVPLPAVGVLMFASLVCLSAAPVSGFGRLFRIVAVAGGAGGLGLVLVQATILQRYCPFCLVVDGIAMMIAVLAVTQYRSLCEDPSPPVADAPGSPRAEKGEQEEETGETPVATAGMKGLVTSLICVLAAGITGVVIGALLTAQQPPPEEILALRHPDRVTIVELVDFRCKYCRAMHRVLDRVEADMGDRVHRVCLTVPTADQPGTRIAARARLCARREGRERAMVDALLIHAGVDLTRCRELAREVGLSVPAFAACMDDPASEEELDKEMVWMNAASPRGLPAVWVEDQRFDGLQGPEVLRAAILRAESRRRESSR
jgi:uncharacterized membrane protein/predicted DsbA family dithiol-disulfide isomerase